MEENSGTNGNKTGKDPVTGRFVEGNTLGGRTYGARDFNTIYKEALIKLAKDDNKTPEEIEDEMLAKGIILSRQGVYQFYKDTLDRRHGKAQENVNVSGELTNKIISVDE